MIQKLKDLSVVYKLVLFVVFIITSITVIVSAISLNSFNESLTDAISENLRNTAELKINSVEQYYLSSIKSLNSFHDQPTVYEKVASILTDSVVGQETIDGFVEISRPFLNSYNYSNIELLDRDLKSRFTFHKVLSKMGQSKVIGKVVDNVIISDIIFENEKFYCYLNRAIKKNGQLIGYISIRMDMAPVYQIIQDTTGLGRTGETLIARRTNDQGALFLNPLRHNPSAALSLSVNKDNENAKPILDAVNRKENIAFSYDYRKKKVLAVSRYIPLLDWGMVAKIDFDEAFVELNRIQRNVILVGVAVMALFIAIVFFVSRIMIKQIKGVESSLNVLAHGNLLNNDLEKVTNDEIGAMIDAVNLLRKNLSDSIVFAKNIGEGKFDLDDHIKENDGELTTALVKMSENLSQVAQEEEKRNWNVKGLALFGNILRENNQDIEMLSEKVLIDLVKYIDASQGAVYVIDEHDGKQMIQMKACYAWNRQKMASESFEFGEGLIGQCVIEKESIFLTEIPQSFISIKSGLGDANPTCILIVPLINNEDVVGVLELAAFTEFEEYKISFIEKLAENIGATISTAKVSETTKALLEESNHLTEQMKAQEEQMRQNMEELLATQEAADRKVQDLEAEIESLKGNN